MPNDRFARGIAACALTLGLPGGTLAAQARAPLADTFASAMGTIMTRMDHDMRIPRSGDANRDFAAMMIPQHQGAVEIAEAELRFGRDPILQRLAQGIIVKQPGGRCRPGSRTAHRFS